MPMYEYECPGCKRVLEVIQKFSDPALTECPECKGPVTKLISRTSFHLKGSGWYATDYKKPAASTSAATSKEDAAPAKPKEESTTTKPAESTPVSTGHSCASGAHGTGVKGNTKS